jgi:hypothetical protein
MGNLIGHDSLSLQLVLLTLATLIAHTTLSVDQPMSFGSQPPSTVARTYVDPYLAVLLNYISEDRKVLSNSFFFFSSFSSLFTCFTSSPDCSLSSLHPHTILKSTTPCLSCLFFTYYCLLVPPFIIKNPSQSR